MADNTLLNFGSGGDLISTDEITGGGGVKVQRVKTQHGLDGVAVDVSAVNPQPVASLAEIAAFASGLTGPFSKLHVHGLNEDIDSASTFEVIWDGGGAYTGFDAVAGEGLTVVSSVAADTGTVQSSGSATSGSATTIVNTGATFVSDGVAVGDIILNDTQSDHGFVSAVTSETTLTVLRMRYGSVNAASDAYRVVTPGSTGSAVARLDGLLDAAYLELPAIYLVLNGTTPVNSTLTNYLRHNMVTAHCHGNGGGNAGVISTYQTTTTANIFAAMIVGANSSLVCATTIPAGRAGWIKQWGGWLANKATADVILQILSRPVGDGFILEESFTVRGDGSSFGERMYHSPRGGLPPMTDVLIQASVDAADIAVGASMELWLGAA